MKVLTLCEANDISKIVTGLDTDLVEDPREDAHMLIFTPVILVLLGVGDCQVEALRKCRGYGWHQCTVL